MTENAASGQFLDLLMAAMLDAVVDGKTCQLQTMITPPGMTKPRLLRLIVVPEDMDLVRPTGVGPFQRPG